MKPKIGRKVYCIYGTGIMVDYVGYVGKDSFIVDSYGGVKNQIAGNGIMIYMVKNGSQVCLKLKRN